MNNPNEIQYLQTKGVRLHEDAQLCQSIGEMAALLADYKHTLLTEIFNDVSIEEHVKKYIETKFYI